MTAPDNEPFTAARRTRRMQPGLLMVTGGRHARGVILVAHGGKARSTAPDSQVRPASLRTLALAAELAQAGRRRGLAVAHLRYRSRGYNDGKAVEDLGWALDRLWEQHRAPVCLVGHSMGARAALRSAGHESVTAVAALAPWLPEGEPVDQLADRAVLIVHGLDDTVTSPRRSAAYAERAERVARSLQHIEVPGSGHAMVRRGRVWHRLVRAFCLDQLAAPAPREAVS